MKVEKIAFCLALALLTISFVVSAAYCQGYHYSWGGSRVVNQGQIGLPNPSGTYIGPGTVSQSARGFQAGDNPGLPAVNMGAHIGRPGDNQYGMNRSFSDAPSSPPIQVRQGQPQYQRPATFGLPPGRMGANIGMPGDDMRSDLHPYTPGQNQSSSARPVFQSKPIIEYQGENVPYTYGDAPGSGMHY